MDEGTFRSSVYMAAVCRCFPGKNPTGGYRVPAPEEIAQCSTWLEREFEILRPALVIPVGKLAIQRVLAVDRMNEVIGRQFRATWRGQAMDVIPLPHPSGASPWHRIEPGKTLLTRALQLIRHHPAMPFVR